MNMVFLECYTFQSVHQKLSRTPEKKPKRPTRDRDPVVVNYGFRKTTDFVRYVIQLLAELLKATKIFSSSVYYFGFKLFYPTCQNSRLFVVGSSNLMPLYQSTVNEQTNGKAKKLLLKGESPKAVV